MSKAHSLYTKIFLLLVTGELLLWQIANLQASCWHIESNLLPVRKWSRALEPEFKLHSESGLWWHRTDLRNEIGAGGRRFEPVTADTKLPTCRPEERKKVIVAAFKWIITLSLSNDVIALNCYIHYFYSCYFSKMELILVIFYIKYVQLFVSSTTIIGMGDHWRWATV